MSVAPEVKERVIALFNNFVSVDDIAASEQVTRNSVCGIVHRARQTPGLITRPAEKSGGGVRRVRVPALKKQVSALPKPVTVPEPILEEPLEPMPEDAVTVMDLAKTVCHWPIGDPIASDFRYCGRKAKGGRPYCEAHARMAYQPRSQRSDGAYRTARARFSAY